MNFCHLWVILSALAFTSPIRAEIYKWIDADGKAHFTASKPVNSVSVERLHAIEAQANQVSLPGR